MARPKNVDKKDWEKYADTTLAHERGSMGKAQLEAEGRVLPEGLDPRKRDEDEVETAEAEPAAEKAEKAPKKRTTKKAKK